MSNKALNYVWQHSESRGSARLVLLALADMANDDGECHPGKANLAQKCRMHPRSVLLAIHKLELAGDVGIFRSRIGIRNKPNAYVIYMGGDDQGSSGVAIRDRHPSDQGSLPSRSGIVRGSDQGSPDPLSLIPKESLSDPESQTAHETPMQKAIREDRERWQ